MGMRQRFPDLPPVWAIGFFAAEWLAALYVPINVFGSPISAALGLVLACLGLGLAGWAAFWFARKKTAIEPGETPSALIVEGPFRINRNPIYTGMTLVLLGLALWLGALSSAIVALGFPFLITARFVRAEERGLRSAFGRATDDYFARTRRW
ncbi:isoprenylcysteine carboxylmethyltransferase family protein [Fulvimarina endophytica]|uniref:Isoprenylcysteine carboxylmethyltransferase family protein n=1 Tax=Fulvimarina endophytica TaxID=2293836 RepID=A0A371X0M6_9HYPH|nr:methyltransferase [Fulvimarina endophytica]RFC62800.1 isoprenylcysteine carboxylmethyltransferase family protein [Fulvimarina endophytica]